MLDAATADALVRWFWPIYSVALTAGICSAIVNRRHCIARTVLALGAGSLAVQAILLVNGGVSLEWWQHFTIDLAVFWLVTLPPRHYWQATIGGLVFAQLAFRAVWAMAPDLGPLMWDASMLVGYGKCLVLFLWAGGPRVELILSRAAGLATRLVLAPPKGELA